MPNSEQRLSVCLADLDLNKPAIITSVSPVVGGADAISLRRMAEIGFLAGENIQVVARIPGGDPLAVRIGSSTFALRRREALSIQVRMLK